MIDDIDLHNPRLTGFTGKRNRFFRLGLSAGQAENPIMTFMERLKWARARSGKSQQALADAVGRSQSAVAEWETGESEPRKSVMPKIATFLEVDPIWLQHGGEQNAPADFGAGASDRGRDWEEEVTKKLTSDTLRNVSAEQFRDAFVPLVRIIGGDRSADRVAKKDYKSTAAMVSKEFSGAASSDLWLYLLTAAAAESAVELDHLNVEYHRYLEDARRQAELLISLSRGNRKSG